MSQSSDEYQSDEDMSTYQSILPSLAIGTKICWKVKDRKGNGKITRHGTVIGVCKNPVDDMVKIEYMRDPGEGEYCLESKNESWVCCKNLVLCKAGDEGH